MKNLKKGFIKSFALLTIVSVILAAGILTSLPGSYVNAATSTQKPLKIKLGVVPGLDDKVAGKVKELGAKSGLEIEVVTFTDGILVNKALSEKQIDANVFQHESFLNQCKKDFNLDIVKVAYTYACPQAVYSLKIKSLAQLKPGATIAIPNDPSNNARALMLLEKAGLIKLKDGADVKTTARDIVKNPKKLQFKEIEANLIPPILKDVDAAVINADNAKLNNLNPKKDGLYVENPKGVWTFILASRAADVKSPAVQKLVELYHSKEIKKYIEDNYSGYVIPAF